MTRIAFFALLVAPAVFAQDLARIAELEDRRSLGDGALLSLATAQDPAVRARAVRAIGRIQDPKTGHALVQRLGDDDRAVRLEAIFALGQVEAEGTILPLVERLDDADPEVRARAAEALGKRKAIEAREALQRRLGDSEAPVRHAAAIALGFVGQKESLEAIRAAADAARRNEAELEWRLVYAAGRIGGEEAVAVLSGAAGSPAPPARTFAALFLGRIASPAGAEALRRLAADREWMVAACAVRALGGLESSEANGKAVRDALGHASPHVRAEACRALAALGARDSLGDLLALSNDDPSRTVAREAFYAQVRLGSETARLRLEGLEPRGPDDRRTLALLEAGAEALSERVAEGDASAAPLATLLHARGPDRIRAALLSGLSEAKPGAQDAFFLLLRGLASPDLAVRGTAADALKSRGDLRALGHLAAAYQDSLEREGHYEVRETIVAAAGAIDSPLAAVFLQSALADPAPSVRTAAATALETRTGKRPELPEAAAAYSPPPVDRTQSGRQVAFETEKGTLVFDLYPEDAPVHVANLLTLVARKHYDGLAFHRVVPAFVVQGGDPRGDGWGDAGYTIRDEINPRPFVRGTLGMPKAGKDTGGCQFFVTHLPTPHLDGRYTVLGQLVEGEDVLDRLEVGDRIVRARIVE